MVMSKKTMKIIVFMAIILCVIAAATLVSADPGFNSMDLTGSNTAASGQIQTLGNQIIGVL